MSKLLSIAIVTAIVGVCQDNTLDKVFINDQEEIFTQEDRASLSVGKDKKRYKAVTLLEAETILVQLKANEAEQKKAAEDEGEEAKEETPVVAQKKSNK